MMCFFEGWAILTTLVRSLRLTHAFEASAMFLSPSILLWFVVAQAPSPSTETRVQLPTNLKPASEVKTGFLKLLDRPRVPLDIKEEKPTTAENGLLNQEVSFATEKKADGTIERVPALVVKPSKNASSKLPVVILLHGTGGAKEGMQGWLDEMAGRGFLAIAIDARYHGDRAGGAKGSAAYVEAITRAWRSKSRGDTGASVLLRHLLGSLAHHRLSRNTRGCRSQTYRHDWNQHGRDRNLACRGG